MRKYSDEFIACDETSLSKYCSCGFISQVYIDERRGDHVMKAYFFPTRSQLQEKKNLTLRFILDRSKSNLTSEDLNSRHDIITKDVDVRWTYGPYLLCPQHIFLSNPKTGAQNFVVAVVVVVILVSSTSYPPFEEKEN